MRNVVGGFFVLYYAANAIGTAALVGKPRKPITPEVAAVMIALFCVLGAAVGWLWRSA